MYRVDRRPFNVGDVITPPTTSYHVALADGGRCIEDALEITRPTNIAMTRADGLFVFRDLCDAIAFHRNVTGSNIYLVKPTTGTTVYHRGDMNFTEIMNGMVSDPAMLEVLSKAYWNGTKTFKPCWEMLTNQMEVVEVLSTSGLKTEFYSTGGHFEIMPSYRNLLNSRVL